MFADPDGDGQKNIRKILQAYALHNPSLGYCQGMGMIVGLLLMRMLPEVSRLFHFDHF
jgi:TBC1 domain family member 10